MKPRAYFEILGLAHLLILPFIAPLLMPHNAALLHLRLAFGPLLLGLLLDALAVFVVGVAAMLVARRLAPRPRVILIAVLSGLVCWWLGVCACLAVEQLSPYAWAHGLVQFADRAQGLLLNLNFAIPAFFAAMAILRPAAVYAIAGWVRLGLAAFSTCALWVVPQLLYVSSLHPIRSFDHSASIPDAGSHRRIVWILMDELSQDMVFDHPLPGASYPNLAHLRASSVVLDQIAPVGASTDRIIPSLLQGTLLDSVRTDSEGNLLVHSVATGKWSPYDAGNSLFSQARDGGWNPGVAGWYNPYCRIFHSVLTSCSWRPGIQSLLPLQMMGASQSRPAWQNALVLPAFFVSRFWSVRGPSENLRQDNLDDFKTVLERSKRLVANDKIHFVYLHLPVPHPPGLYDRRTHQLCACGNYIDNLTLADDTLAVLLHSIDASPSAGQTTVILSSDHSWRPEQWRTEPFWTEEEDRIAQHFSDARPVFLVRFPGQQQQVDVTAPVPELAEHDLIAGMLDGKISTADELVRAVPAAAQTPGLH
jgi:hypothetical protein